MSINGIDQIGKKYKGFATNGENGIMARRRLLPKINAPAGDEITKAMVQFLNEFYTKRSDIANWQ